MAWEIGMLAGLQEGGIDLTSADLLVGTSAGSVVAAQVACGVSLSAMLDRQLAASSGEIAASVGGTYVLRLFGRCSLPAGTRSDSGCESAPWLAGPEPSRSPNGGPSSPTGWGRASGPNVGS